MPLAVHMGPDNSGTQVPLEWVMVMRRISWFIGLAVGILLIAAAPIVRWAVAPAVTVLPSDTNTMRVYTGTASTVINPSLLRGTLFGPALLHNQPISVIQHVKVLDTSGNNALVQESKRVTLQNNAIANVTHRYAVDRKDMGAGSGFNGVTAQTGLTFNWPIHTGKQNYTGWVSDIQATTPLVYAGEATRGGINTYVFKASVPSTRVTDPAELSGLPSSVLSTLPDPVPFGYLFSATSTYWIAPGSGVVVDVASHEVRTSGFVVAGQILPVGPVLDFTYTSPALTLTAAASDAKDKAAQMRLISTTIPLVALITGGVILLVLIGTAVYSRRRTTAPPMTPPTTMAPPRERELTPVG